MDDLVYSGLPAPDGRGAALLGAFDRSDRTSEALPCRTGVHTVALDFDEQAYLETYDDVIIALDTEEFETALQHFERYGRQEGRHADERYIQALGYGSDRPSQHDAAQLFIDAVVVSVGGTALVIGWTDDRDNPIGSLLIVAEREHAWLTTAFGRLRRSDVEAVLQVPPGHLFGFWAVVQLAPNLPVRQPWTIRTRHGDGLFRQIDFQARLVGDVDLRERILAHFAGVEFFGNRDIESFMALSSGIGSQLIELNRRITASIVSGAWVATYGPVRPGYKGSIIVCLFGKSEFMFLQAALFSTAPGFADYEFVFVSNSPELTEVLQKEARICARIYGISIVLVCLPDNAGFGAANNVAARYARSDRLLITNPDVFSRDDDWARRHTEIIETLPREQTMIFGAPLYYDDGSLMHHGMYFEIDEGTSVRPDGIFSQAMIRVEHYGKGAPQWTQQFACPRRVPAVTGAFISVDRRWFEELGGFNEDFLFGHYEDADLCLRSLIRDRPVWIHDFPLWHLEGKGSTRRPAHEGGSLVNRWLFTNRWGDLIREQLHGPNPVSPVLAPRGEVIPAAIAPASKKAGGATGRKSRAKGR